MEKKMKKLEEENAELKICVSQEEEHINELEKINNELKNKNSKIEHMTREMIKIFGYEIDD